MTEFEILNLIIAGASEGGGFDWSFVTEHTVNLLILLAVIVYFAKSPVKDFLISRRAKISHDIDEAQKTIKEAKERYEEYAQKLKGIEEEIASLKTTLKSQGETERDEIVKHAKQTSEILSKEARDTIELEAQRAKREIQYEVVALAIDIAEKTIKENLGETEKEKLLSQFTKDIEEEKWHQSQH